MLSGCSLGYYVQSARGQAALMSQRVPIDEVVADPATAADLRARLEKVQEARKFASDVLGLPENKGYRSYADIGRPYAVWSVSATEEFSLEPLRWCFPVAGCVSYRGYFNEASAQRFAERLRGRGLEVSVRGVAAYSTLGYFDDPVLSSMLRWDDIELIAIVFHELAHQLVYVKNDSPFNESFASVVEQVGMSLWTQQRGLPNELQAYQERLASKREFAALIAEVRAELDALYASGASEAEKRRRKSALFATLVRRYEARRDAGKISRGYDAWFARDLNNADLAAVGLYQQWVPAFQVLLARSGHDLQALYAEARRLGKMRAEEREEVLLELSKRAQTEQSEFR
ncbi:MAG: aminopeptidase [Gammaproteobacteria bacterium]|nr:aminopeptidase [Gammaproteobacteria bacterium]